MKGKIIEYRLIVSLDEVQFNVDVNNLVRAGWEPFHKTFYAGGPVAQAMVKRAPLPKEYNPFDEMFKRAKEAVDEPAPNNSKA